jgi:hypothetical protein
MKDDALTRQPIMATVIVVSRLHSTRKRENLKCSPSSPKGSTMMRSYGESWAREASKINGTWGVKGPA